jgi:hypothetical protein
MEKKWECRQGCDLSQGVVCKHLEKLIDTRSGESLRGNKRSVSIVYTDNLERYEGRASKFYQGNLYDDEVALRANLEGHGLDQREIEIVIDRLVKDKTFNEIAKDRGYSAPQPAQMKYSQVVDKLKLSGFGTKPKGNK